VKRDALLLLRTKKKQACKNILKNQLLMVFFNGREILRVIEVELHNVTGRVLGQLCKF
jgi:hypothetical protein